MPDNGGVGGAQEALASIGYGNAALRQLYESSRIGYALNEAGGPFLEFNEAFRAITGYSGDELRKMDYSTLTPPEFHDEDRRQVAILFESGHFGPYEKEYRRKDGSRVRVRMHGLLTRGPNGERHVWSIVRDITESSRVADALAASEARLRSVFESMVEGVVVQARDGSIVDFNSAAAKILGLPHGELLGRNSMDPRWQAMREDGTPWRGEEHPVTVSLRTGRPVRGALMRLRLPDGKERWISINAQPVYTSGDHLPDMAVVTFGDVTETRRVVDELQAARADLQAILDHVPGRVTAWNADVTNRFMNRAAEREFGVQHGAAKGRHARELIGDARFEQLQGVIEPLLGGRPQCTELAERMQDGSTRHMRLVAVPLYDKDRVVGMLSLATDVTELRDVHRRLRELAQHLETVRDDERHALADALHEGVAQDLFAARIQLHRLAGDAGVAPAVAAGCREIEATLERAIRATREVSQGLRPTTLGATGFLPALEDHVQRFSRLSGLDVAFEVDDGFPALGESTGLLFYRAAQEALNNVALHAHASRVTLRLLRRDDSVRMEIEDDGVGFRLEALDKAGSLGLFSIRERFQSKGGRCEVQTSPGEGTTIAVAMPHDGG